MSGYGLSRFGPAVVAALALSACGGSGGSSSNLLTGVFIDSPVAGVEFVTETQSGVTNAAGEFTYRSGETVTFSLGGWEMGSASADAEVSVFDIAGVEEVPMRAGAISNLVWGANDTPMRRAATIGSILQTLDEDANPDNGIVIPETIRQRLADVNWDVSAQTAWQIMGTREFRMMLRDESVANANFPAREARQLGEVVQHMYDQAGLDVSYDVWTTYQQDRGADGSVDFSREIAYDGDGNYRTDLYDFDGDGVNDTIYNYMYTPADQLRRIERDDGLDGSIESTRIWTYNEFGDRTQYQDIAATGEATYSETMQYSEFGDVIYRERVRPTSRVIETWEYNPETNRREIYQVDSDGDGAFDTRDQLTYETSFNWTRRERDMDMDGVTDEIHTRTYDAFGRVVRETQDTDVDGELDYAVTRVYDSRGLLLSTEWETTGDGIVDRIDVTEYNEQGNRMRLTNDLDGDGNLDQIYEWIFDESGTQTEFHRDNDGDGTRDWSRFYVRDSAGLLTETRTDTDADGTVDQVNRREYDVQDRLISITDDTNNDGMPENVTTYSNYISLPLRRGI